MKILFLVLSGFFFFACFNKDPYELWQEQPNQKIVFMSRYDALTGELYLLDKDNRVTRLTENDRHDDTPSLSADGRKVAFMAGDERDTASWEIYVIDLQTHVETRLTDNAVGDVHPDWSPDGSRIVYASFQDDAGNPAAVADICVMNADGSGFLRLTDNLCQDGEPAWSEDGSRIAFVSSRHSGTAAREELFIMDRDGANPRRLTSPPAGWESDHQPDWSPDGSSLVFCRYRGVRPWTDIANLDTLQQRWYQLIPWNVCRVDTLGSVQALTDVEYAATQPVYSGDGAGILCNWWDCQVSGNQLTGVNHTFVLIGRDGGDPVRMIPDIGYTRTMENFDW